MDGIDVHFHIYGWIDMFMNICIELSNSICSLPFRERRIIFSHTMYGTQNKVRFFQFQNANKSEEGLPVWWEKNLSPSINALNCWPIIQLKVGPTNPSENRAWKYKWLHYFSRKVNANFLLYKFKKLKFNENKKYIACFQVQFSSFNWKLE